MELSTALSQNLVSLTASQSQWTGTSERWTGASQSSVEESGLSTTMQGTRGSCGGMFVDGSSAFQRGGSSGSAPARRREQGSSYTGGSMDEDHKEEAEEASWREVIKHASNADLVFTLAEILHRSERPAVA